MKTFQDAISAEELYESMWKCKRGKMWKASVARHVLHGIEETLKLEEQLRDGTYKPRKPREFTLYYPKVRPCSSTHIRDRIVQRSLNDNVIYPLMTHGFIWDNMACQKGKGTKKAMDRLSAFLHRAYINNGNSVDGLYVLQADVKGYYGSMRHSDAEECFRRKLDNETADAALSWLARQYPGDRGYSPGSQMVQILGISMLDRLDHAVKERMGAKLYGRYMDDSQIIATDEAYLERCRDEIAARLAKLGMELHPKKTRIDPLSEGIKTLGFTFRVTDTGKVLRLIDPDNVKHERKKLFRMAVRVSKGEVTEEKFNQCYQSWKAHAELGDTWKMLRRMDEYVEELRKEFMHHENFQTA